MAHVQINHPKLGSDTYTVHWRDATRHRRRTFRVKREAERFALSIENELAAGQSTAPFTRNGKTVAEVVDDCMAVAATKLKPRTVLSYQQGYARHVLPVFGSKRISALTSQDVERWVASLHASGLAPATVRNTFVALNKVCRYAVRHRLMGQNPCTGTELPRASHADAFRPKFLTPGEVSALSTHLSAAHPDAPYGLIVRVAAYTGLRAGELAALRIKDVNTFKREIRVERNVQRIAGEWVVGTPKSARSTRTVPLLHDDLVAGLTAHIAAHPHRPDPEAALWPGRTPGTHAVDYSRHFDHLSFYRWYFKPAARAVGLPSLHFHDLRHTYASLMFAAGVDVYKVSRWLGHGSMAVTDGVYAHLYQTDNAAERDRVAVYMASVATPAAPTPLRRPLQGS